MAVVKLDAKRTIVLLSLAAGSSRAAAAGKAEISARTLRRWLAAEDAFAEAVEIASGKGREMYEAIIREAARSDWRAAAWMLEVLWVGRTKSGPEEEAAPTTMPIASGAPSPTDPDHSAKVLAILVETLGQEGAERVIANRMAQIERDRAEGRLA